MARASLDIRKFMGLKHDASLLALDNSKPPIKNVSVLSTAWNMWDSIATGAQGYVRDLFLSQ